MFNWKPHVATTRRLIPLSSRVCDVKSQAGKVAMMVWPTGRRRWRIAQWWRGCSFPRFNGIQIRINSNGVIVPVPHFRSPTHGYRHSIGVRHGPTHRIRRAGWDDFKEKSASRHSYKREVQINCIVTTNLPILKQKINVIGVFSNILIEIKM